MPRVLVEKRFGYQQTTPSHTWNITHNLGVQYPVVDVWLTSNNTTMNSDAYQVTVLDEKTVVITFDPNPNDNLPQLVTGYALIT